MKNCISGGQPMGAHMRVSVKQPSQARIKKMLSKKKLPKSKYK